MKKVQITLFSLMAICFTAIAGFAQTTIYKADLSQAKQEEIIAKMSANEVAFRVALNSYVFNRKFVISTIGFGGQVTGTYRRDSFITFTDDGERFEKITFNPMPTTYHGFVTIEDEQDIGGVNTFALQPSTIRLYNYTYLGKERIDELDLYVYDIAPKVMPDPKKSDLRLFQGRIWIDDRDFMLIKTKGKAVPEGEDKIGNDQRFPVVETWRENIDGKFWFPSYATADDELVFANGEVLKLKMRIKFSDYAQGRSSFKLLDDPDEVTSEEPVEKKEVDPNAPPPLPTKKP